MHKIYTFQNEPVEISTLQCQDGDMILSIGNFPTKFTVYFDRAGAEAFAQQIMDTMKSEATI